MNRKYLATGLISLSAAAFVSGILLLCIAELRTSAWMVEVGGQPEEYWRNADNADRWYADVQLNNKLRAWSIVLVPLGAGALLAITPFFASTLRFSLRSLFIGVACLCLSMGIVWPRLQNPRFVYRPDIGDIAFEQHRDPASESKISAVSRKSALVAVAPLLVLPILILLVRRSVAPRPPESRSASTAS